MAQTILTLFNKNITNFSDLDGRTGQTIWINGDINFSGSGTATVGTPSNPVILIVSGNVNLTKTAFLTVYGIFYVIGSFTDNSGYIGYGQTLVEHDITFKSGGTVNINLAILSTLGMQSGQLNYSSNNIGCPQELFP